MNLMRDETARYDRVWEKNLFAVQVVHDVLNMPLYLGTSVSDQSAGIVAREREMSAKLRI